MKLTIVAVTFALIFVISTLFLIWIRKIERAGGTLQTSSNKKLIISFIPGAVLGSMLYHWFYFETGLKNTLLSSSPFPRQIADLVCIVAFTIAGFATVEGIRKVSSQKRKDANAAEQGAAANP